MITRKAFGLATAPLQTHQTVQTHQISAAKPAGTIQTAAAKPAGTAMTLNTEKLVSLLGSEEAAQRFVEMFQQQWPEQLAALKQALKDEDWGNASNTAHSLKSQCRYLGLDNLADILQNIENQPDSSHDLSLFPPVF